MRTRHLFVSGALALGAITVGAGTRHALAQQGVPLAAPAPSMNIRCQKKMTGAGPDHARVMTIEGDVRINNGGRPVVLTTSTNGLTIGARNKEMRGNTVHIPMGLATLRVSVTPSGTIFEDQQGNKLTVETRSQPK